MELMDTRYSENSTQNTENRQEGAERVHRAGIALGICQLERQREAPREKEPAWQREGGEKQQRRVRQGLRVSPGKQPWLFRRGER